LSLIVKLRLPCINDHQHTQGEFYGTAGRAEILAKKIIDEFEIKSKCRASL
jgi:hypothetical protein